MTPTERIAAIIGANVPEHNDSLGHGYRMFDTGGVECEVGEFLYGLVRAVKPHRMLTTGIHYGISDSYIALAMAANGYGRVTAIETNPDFIRRARDLWVKLGVNQYVETVMTLSLNYTAEGVYEMMWLDTEPQVRFAELVKFWPNVVQGGFVGIHDMPRQIPPAYVQFNPNVPRGLGLLKVHFQTPRGFVLLYKPHESDATWGT